MSPISVPIVANLAQNWCHHGTQHLGRCCSGEFSRMPRAPLSLPPLYLDNQLIHIINL
jgi:hypothetical protein